MNKYKFIIFFSLSILTINAFSQRKTSLSQAVKLAGKQRTLAQRMAKDKIFIKGGVRNNVASKELEESLSNFDFGIQYLRDFAPSKDIKHKVDILEYTYRQYKAVIIDNDKDSFSTLFNDNTLFLSICDDVVTSLIEYGKIKNLTITSKNRNYIIENKVKATSASGKLTYLTQRLALYYGFNNFDIKKFNPKTIEDIINEMEKNLDYLTIQEFNTLEIDDSLSKLHHYWNELKTRLYTNDRINLNSQNISSREIFDICNDIMMRANNTTTLYSQLSTK